MCNLHVCAEYVNFQWPCKNIIRVITYIRNSLFNQLLLKFTTLIILVTTCDYFLREWTILNLLTIVNQKDYFRDVAFFAIYVELLNTNTPNCDYVHIPCAITYLSHLSTARKVFAFFNVVK